LYIEKDSGRVDIAFLVALEVSGVGSVWVVGGSSFCPLLENEGVENRVAGLCRGYIERYNTGKLWAQRRQPSSHEENIQKHASHKALWEVEQLFRESFQ